MHPEVETGDFAESKCRCASAGSAVYVRPESYEGRDGKAGCSLHYSQGMGQATSYAEKLLAMALTTGCQAKPMEKCPGS